MTVELTAVEDGEQVAVTRRMAIDALADYAEASVQEKQAANTKASLSKAILKPWLAEHEGEEALYDGESGYEARLTPHSAPRWLDTQGMDAALIVWATELGLLKLNLKAIDSLPETTALTAFKDRIKPGGTGEPRLSVSKRED